MNLLILSQSESNQCILHTCVLIFLAGRPCFPIHSGFCINKASPSPPVCHSDDETQCLRSLAFSHECTNRFFGEAFSHSFLTTGYVPFVCEGKSINHVSEGRRAGMWRCLTPPRVPHHDSCIIHVYNKHVNINPFNNRPQQC